MTTAEPLVQPYQYLPQPSDADYERLKKSIREAGGLWPGHEIVVDENGVILDGYTRERVCAELELPCPRRVRTDLTSEDEKFAYIVNVNMARRHLTIDQKRQLTTEYLRRFPEKSNRAIAAEVGLADKTVGVVRHEAEASAEITQTARPHTRPDQDRWAADQPKSEAVYPPDHKNTAYVTITVNYPVPSETERTRAGLPYPKEAERAEWQSDPIAMQTSIPASLLEVGPFIQEAADHWRRAVRADPFKTMLR